MRAADGLQWGNLMGKKLARLAVWGLVAMLAACGGGGGGGSDEPATPGTATVGAAGGTVSDGAGATVIVPAGALEADTTIRVAMDSSGAPALPPGLAAAGNTYVVTPHGGEFAQGVEVRIPAPNVTLQPNQELKLAKAQPGGEWVVLGDSELRDGVITAEVNGFSFFVPVLVTYLVPLSQVAPFAITGSTLDCYGQDCLKLVGLATVTWNVTTNNGQLPANCSNAVNLKIGRGTTSSSLDATGFSALPLTGGSFTASAPADRSTLTLVAGLRCSGPPSFSRILRSVGARRAFQPPYPNLSVVVVPAQLNVVAGLRANLDVVLNGGSSQWEPGPATFAAPTPTNRAEVDWQRSDDDGASWRVVARSYQDEADPRPMGSTVPWSTWGLRHGFVASAADQGALIRVRACYTPPDVPAPPCVTGAATRINVLQQSALPSIVGAPRSVLVRTGQTASLSATAGGAPVPTLQWQTRAANDNGAWADVAGATGGSHTTDALALADNGRQYRVVASNALGNAASAGVTVSVSDLDVAPTISTQPASLSVASGSDAAFAIAARGTEALSYQWRFNGIAISGANSPVLRLAAVNAGQAGAYSVAVTNAAGSAISDTAALTVSAGTPGAVAPTIVTQPVSVLVNAGNTATFAVGASGSGALNYQWLRNGLPITGATAAFYSIAQAAVGDAATYAVQVSNGVGPGVTSFNVVLTVNQSAQPAAVAIGVQPAPQVQTPGGSVTFAVAVSGSAPIAYQWLKNGAPIAGATSAVLTLIGVNGSDVAAYSVTVSNALLSVTSDPAGLTVVGAPLISAQPAAASVSEGSSATFSVVASGSALLYQWTRNGAAIAGATSASHSTPALTLADSGAVYAVLIFNGAGLSFSQTAVLSVTAPPVSVGGSVSGLAAAGLVLQNNAGDNLAVAASGAFTFATRIALGTTYSVTVLSQPSGQRCVVQGGSGTATAAVTSVVLTCTSAGGLALVANSGANTLSVMRVDADTGALTAAGSPVATGQYPFAVAVTPGGQYAYVTNLVGGSISSFGIDGSTGVLTPIPLSTPGTQNPYGIAMDPLGRFVWVVNYGFSTASAFAINPATGVLTAVGTPVATGGFPYALAAHPNGNFVYVANEGSNSVSVFSVDSPTGALTLVAGTIANSVLRPHGIAVDPSGRFVYVAGAGGQEVAAYRINSSTGALTVVGYIRTGGAAESVAVHPNGQFVYAVTRSSDAVAIFSINPTTGALTSVGTPVAAGANPGRLAVNTAGSRLYVTNGAGNTVSAFNIGSGGATLTSLGAATAVGRAPEGVALTP